VPLPKLAHGFSWERVKQEFNFSGGRMILIVIALVLWGKMETVEEKLVCLAVAVGAVGWEIYKRRNATIEDFIEIDTCSPLNSGERSEQFEIIFTAIAAAFLENEGRGLISLQVVSGGVQSIPTRQTDLKPPPRCCLEHTLLRARTMPVEHVIFDWMADNSNWPQKRAIRLIEASLIARGIAVPTMIGEERAASIADPATRTLAVGESGRVLDLLSRCREERPDLWQALRGAVASGLEMRCEPPRYEQKGQVSVPVYDYRESDVMALMLDTDPAQNTAAPVPDEMAVLKSLADTRSGPTEMLVQQVGLTPKATASNLVGAMVVVAGMIGGALWAIFADDSPRAVATRALLTVVIAFAVSGGLRFYLHRRISRQIASGLRSRWPAEWEMESRDRWIFRGFAGALLFLLAAACPGGWAYFVPSALVVGFCVANLAWNSLPTQDVRAAVTRRMRELKMASPGAPVAVSPAAPAPILSSPLQFHLVDSADLPSPADEVGYWGARAQMERRRNLWLLPLLLAFFAGGLGLVYLAKPQSQVAAAIGLFGIFLFVFVSIGMFFFGGRSPNAYLALFRWAVLFDALLVLLLKDTPENSAVSRPEWGDLPWMLGAIALAGGSYALQRWNLKCALDRYPLAPPRRLTMLRVFGSPSYEDLLSLLSPWLNLGVIEYLEGSDTVAERDDVQDAVEEGKIDEVLVKTPEEVAERLRAFSTDPDDELGFGRNSFQCLGSTWQLAIIGMLDRADAVVMDLSSLGPKNQGCAWELSRLLHYVPLARVTLLINDSTDLDVLRTLLSKAAESIPVGSPNAGAPVLNVNLLRIGGLSQRLDHESYHEWLRRCDSRLDPFALTGHLLRTATPYRAEPNYAQWKGVLRRILLDGSRFWIWVCGVFLLLTLLRIATRW
jgi:hypothetical protein